METFNENLVYNDEFDVSLPAEKFAKALFNAYTNRDLSALLMCLCNNTVFDLLRNSYIIPYRFNADGHQNPIIMTDEHGNPLPEYKHISHDKNYIHFHEIYNDMPDKKDIYYAQAYRYSHTYDSEHMTPTQQVIVKHDGILLIRELPDTVKLKETEAEAYSAVWDLMIQIEKEREIQRNTRFFVACHNGALNRCGTAPTGQNGTVNVQMPVNHDGLRQFLFIFARYKDATAFNEFFFNGFIDRSGGRRTR